MKPNSNCCPIRPRHVRRKSASRFCIFPEVGSSCTSPSSSPVYLNVYDLTPYNGYIYWAGIGVFHTGVEVHGVEYAFGAHDNSSSGVFEVEPCKCPGFKFRRSIYIGTTYMDRDQVREFIETRSLLYAGDNYNLITKNCNHFCEDICYSLTGNNIPGWVNRLARIGSICDFILPEGLKATTVGNDDDDDDDDDDSDDSENEKKRGGSFFDCFSSISPSPKRRGSSSELLCLHTPDAGIPKRRVASSDLLCLHSPNVKSSIYGSVKET